MKKSSYLFLFFTSFVSMIIILLPDIIKNHGLFLYAGDYFFQQIPFYYHASDVVHNYKIGWDWYTDLGSDFITAYSYYLTGSVFFWLISWLSADHIIYAMPLMIAFKTAIGSVGAFAYIRRYVNNNSSALIGAYLYAFSGYQMVSLVFNTFHDITALFPFLILAFDMLILENKKAFFAFMVGLVALTNYFFFVGTAFFIVIYYIIKCVKKEFVFSVRKFLLIVFETVLGVGIAAVILFPTFKVLSSADRVGNILYGVDLVSYSDNTIIPKILQSLFIIPDPPSKAMLFESHINNNNWASISLYLPLFTVTGVAVYLKNNKKEWLSTMLVICFIIALVPAFNSIFSLFNSSYYARWYYMPVLLMALATSKSIDNKYDFNYGIKMEFAGVVLLAIISCFPDKVVKQEDRLLQFIDSEYHTELKFFSLSKIPVVFWQCIAFAIISVLIVYIFNREKIFHGKNIRKPMAILIAFVIVTNVIYINNTVLSMSAEYEGDLFYNNTLGFEPELGDNTAFRTTHLNNKAFSNYSMCWKLLNAGCFHSVEANESDEFYYQIKGEKRLVMSDYNETDYPAFGLLSVKYIFNPSTGDDINVERKRVDLNGFSLYDKQGSYYIYRNDNFVPFGFSYDYYIDNDSLEKYLDDNVDSANRYQYKMLAMMRALVLDTVDIEKYKNYIEPLPESMLDDLDENTYFSDCNARRGRSCSSFEYDSNGYRAEISTDRKSLVYFSVPCSSGWTAKVNGKDADVIKVHYGLTAVAVDEGNSKIEFSYETPGLKEGMIISIASLSVLVLYCLLNIMFRYKRKVNVQKEKS